MYSYFIPNPEALCLKGPPRAECVFVGFTSYLLLPSLIQSLESERMFQRVKFIISHKYFPLDKGYRLNSLVLPKVEMREDSERNEKGVGELLCGNLSFKKASASSLTLRPHGCGGKVFQKQFLRHVSDIVTIIWVGQGNT